MSDEQKLGEVRHCLTSVYDILRTGIISSENTENPFFKASITWNLLHLYDALKLSEKLGERCSLKGDEIQEFNEGDLTALYSAARAAACHVPSLRRNLKISGDVGTTGPSVNLYGAWNICAGKNVLYNINGCSEENPFDDDIMIVFGGVRFFAIRNTLSAYEWLRERYYEEMPSFGRR